MFCAVGFVDVDVSNSTKLTLDAGCVVTAVGGGCGDACRGGADGGGGDQGIRIRSSLM
jgi:hypothetical protein